MDAPTLSMWLMLSDSTSAYFRWPEIKKCAAEAIPAQKPQQDITSGILSPEWAEYQEKFKITMFCREVLAARHEGWKAATDAPDPYPPEPMMRADDLK